MKSNNKFFIPQSIKIFGNFTNLTQGKILTVLLNTGFYLSLEEEKKKDCITFSHDKPGEDIHIHITDLQKRNSSWASPILKVFKAFIYKGWNPTGMTFRFTDTVNKPFTEDIEIAQKLLTTLALNYLSNISLSKIDLLQIAIVEKDSKINFDNYLYGFTSLFGKSREIMLIDSHNFEYKTYPSEFKDVTFVTIRPEREIIITDDFYKERLSELETIKTTINNYFEVPYLGALQGEDHEWLDKVLEEENLKNRLRHIVNENTRVELAANLIKDKQWDKLGNLMNDAYDSAVLDFEINLPEIEFIIDIVKSQPTVLGFDLIITGKKGEIIALLKKSDIKNFKKAMKDELKDKISVDISEF